MAATVREAVRELLEQTIATMEALLDASDRELPRSSSHACAQGKDLWTLITNDIDHEKIHTGQVLEGRYESRITASPMQRLIAEWLAERARLVEGWPIARFVALQSQCAAFVCGDPGPLHTAVAAGAPIGSVVIPATASAPIQVPSTSRGVFTSLGAALMT